LLYEIQQEEAKKMRGVGQMAHTAKQPEKENEEDR